MPIHYTPRLRSIQPRTSRPGTIYHEPSPRWRRGFVEPNADPSSSSSTTTTIKPFINGRNANASIVWEDGGRTPYLAFSKTSVPFFTDEEEGKQKGGVGHYYYLKESADGTRRKPTEYPRHGNLASTFYDVVDSRTRAVVPGLEKAAWTWDTSILGERDVSFFSEAYPGEEHRKILEGLVGINEHQLGTWFEEKERILPEENHMAHFRDAFHRVDAVRSTRHVQVWSKGKEDEGGDDGKGVLLAESRDFIMVFETALPNRYYLKREDVIDADKRLSKDITGFVTVCPYKGLADYHHGE